MNEVDPSALLEGHLKLFVGLRDATKLVDEVHVPRGPAEFAVGRALKAKVLLQFDGARIGVVLDVAQCLGVDADRRRMRHERARAPAGRKRLPT